MNHLAGAGLEALRRIKSQPEVILQVGSKAVWAFDPYITRRLHTFMPTRFGSLPSQPETWSALERMFSGWLEISLLLKAESLAVWEVC